MTDLYSTDGEIAYYDFVALEDDLQFFPAYDAVFICRADVSAEVKRMLSVQGGRIDATAMT